MGFVDSIRDAAHGCIEAIHNVLSHCDITQQEAIREILAMFWHHEMRILADDRASRDDWMWLGSFVLAIHTASIIRHFPSISIHALFTHEYTQITRILIASRLWAACNTDGMVVALERIRQFTMQYIRYGDIQDIWGAVFQRSMPPAMRKQLAAYYTRTPYARFLARLSVRTSNDTVIDFACGAGSLILGSAYIRHTMSPQPSYLQGLYANDLLTFATIIAHNNCLLYVNHPIVDATITSGDGLAIQTRPTARSLAQFIRNTTLAYPFVNIVMMNPPFSRRANMSPDETLRLDRYLRARFPGKASQYANGNMGLHGYFIYHADQFLTRGGTIAMILPISTFTADYTQPILRFLADQQYAITYLIEQRASPAAFSEDAAFKECIIIAQKNMLTSTSVTRIISLHEHLTNDTSILVADRILTCKGHSSYTERTMPTADLYGMAKWTSIFEDDIPIIETMLQGSLFESYDNNQSQLRITRGFDATYSDYLMLPNETWQIDDRGDYYSVRSNSGEMCPLPKQYTIPAVRKASDVTTVIFTPHWIALSIPYIIPDDLRAFHDTYLTWAAREIITRYEGDADRGHRRVDVITSPRLVKGLTGVVADVSRDHPWYSRIYHAQCQDNCTLLFHVYKFGLSHAITLTPLATSPAIANHAFYCVEACDSELYAAWCNSTLYYYQLLRYAQKVADGYYKMAIHDFDAIRYPRDDICDTDRERVITVFFTFHPTTSICDQIRQRWAGRVALDTAWLTAMHVTADHIPIILETLYRWFDRYW